jgi:hypothetical protein
VEHGVKANRDRVVHEQEARTRSIGLRPGNRRKKPETRSQGIGLWPFKQQKKGQTVRRELPGLTAKTDQAGKDPGLAATKVIRRDDKE